MACSCDYLLIVEECVCGVIASHVSNDSRGSGHIYPMVFAFVSEVKLVKFLLVVAVLEGKTQRKGQPVRRARVQEVAVVANELNSLK